jgi:hypothetical protein
MNGSTASMIHRSYSPCRRARSSTDSEWFDQDTASCEVTQ